MAIGWQARMLVSHLSGSAASCLHASSHTARSVCRLVSVIHEAPSCALKFSSKCSFRSSFRFRPAAARSAAHRVLMYRCFATSARRSRSAAEYCCDAEFKRRSRSAAECCCDADFAEFAAESVWRHWRTCRGQRPFNGHKPPSATRNDHQWPSAAIGISICHQWFAVVLNSVIGGDTSRHGSATMSEIVWEPQPSCTSMIIWVTCEGGYRGGQRCEGGGREWQAG